MRASIYITPKAEERIREASSWWSENRRDAVFLFDDELAAAFSVLSEMPDIGPRYPHRGIPGLRRWLLRHTRYHLYYVYDESEQRVVVLSVWSASRGKPPLL